jgi:hypothetical protein
MLPTSLLRCSSRVVRDPSSIEATMPRCGEVGCATRRRLCALLVALTFVLPATATQAQSPPDPRTAAEQSIRRLDLQTQLPREPELKPLRLTLPPEAVWLIAAFGLGLLLYMFRDMLPAWGLAARGAWTPEEEAAAGSAARPPEAVLAAADDLARQGRFVDAMHVLLLQGLADIRRHLGEQFADSLTSREILRSTKLSEEGRSPLRDIISRVEWTYFGDHPAERADYAACRASFDALARAIHGRAAA